jgi:hypothetical protein
MRRTYSTEKTTREDDDRTQLEEIKHVLKLSCYAIHGLEDNCNNIEQDQGHNGDIKRLAYPISRFRHIEYFKYSLSKRSHVSPHRK